MTCEDDLNICIICGGCGLIPRHQPETEKENTIHVRLGDYKECYRCVGSGLLDDTWTQSLCIETKSKPD
jgi:hypothetical protein